VDITKDIRSLTEFKRDSKNFVSRLKETGRPAILTVNGEPELVIMDAQTWQDNQDQMEYARAVAGIRKGLDQVREGRGIEASVLFDDLRSPKGR